MENDHVMDATSLCGDAGLSEPRISLMGVMGCDVGWVRWCVGLVEDHVMDATSLCGDAGLSEPRISLMGGMGCDVGWVLGAGGEV